VTVVDSPFALDPKAWQRHMPRAATSSSEDHVAGGEAEEGRTLERDRLRSWLIEAGFQPFVADVATSDAATLRQALTLALTLADGPIAHIVDSSSGRVRVLSETVSWEPDPVPSRGDSPDTDEAEACRNAWNSFQRRLAGAGLSRAEASHLYREERDAVATATMGRCARSAPAGRHGAASSGRAGGSRGKNRASSGEAVSPAAPLGSSSACSQPAASPDQGYVVLRVPTRLEGLRGVHHCTWGRLLARFGLQHQEWERIRKDFYTPRFTTIAAAQHSWEVQGLAGRVPVHDA